MKKEKILIVEDEAFIAHDIQNTLKREGYVTYIDCFNVDMAIQMVHEKDPDLVLIDINLGERKNGIDLAEYLEKVVHRPYIFITSYSDRPTLQRVSELSPCGYITKPFKPQDLITTVFLALSKQAAPRAEAQEEKVIPFAITQVLIHIDQNIRERLDLESLAGMTGWEQEHFGRVFKEHIGLSPYQYILKSKVELAKRLLAETDESTQSICFDLGFSNYSNFYNAFKKYVNMSPERYRALMTRR